MFKIPAPNYTQTPNVLFDEWLPLLGMAELKVLMVIMRKTFGWHKIKDRISLSQLQKITGLERTNVLNGVKGLIKKGLVIKIVTGEKGSQDTHYELVVIEDSNNFNQCCNDTTPSAAAAPTKETLTKEKEITPPTPSKGDLVSFGSFVKLRNKEFEDLAQLVGSADDLFALIDEINDYLLSTGKKPYKDYAATIRNWWRRRRDKPKPSKQESETAKNTLLANGIINKFPTEVQRNHIQLQSMGLLFCYGSVYELIKFDEHGFRDRILSRLQKMNLPTNGL